MRKHIKYINRYKDMSDTVKSSLWFTVSNFFQKGIQFFTVPIFTRLLTVEQYGQFNIYQTWLSLLIILGTLNLANDVSINGLNKYGYDKKRFIASMQGLSSIVTIVLFFVYFINRSYWNSFIQLPQIVIFVILIEVFLTPSFQLWSINQKFEYKYKLLLAITISISIINPIISYVAIVNSDNRGTSRILACSIINICIGLIFYLYNLIIGKTFFDRKYWRFALLFVLPLVPHYLSSVVLNQSDRLMIQYYSGNSKVALYSIAYSIGMIINIFTASINASFVPWTYQTYKKGNIIKIRNYSTQLTLFVAVVTFIPILLAPEVINIMGNKSYASAMWIVPPVAIASYFNFIYSLFSNIEFYYSNGKYAMLASLFAALLNIFLNICFIPLIGFIAAAYTTLACFILLSVFHYFAMKLVLKRNKVDNEIYNIKAIVKCSLGLIIVSIGCMILYNHVLIRYFAIIITIITLVINRKTIICLIKNMKFK